LPLLCSSASASSTLASASFSSRYLLFALPFDMFGCVFGPKVVAFNELQFEACVLEHQQQLHGKIC